MPEQALCGMCKRPVLYLRSDTGILMGLDPEPCPGGRVIVVDGVAHTLRGDLFEQHYEWPTYFSHVVTCPKRRENRVIVVDGVAHTLRGDLFEQHYEGPTYFSHVVTCPKRREKKK